MSREEFCGRVRSQLLAHEAKVLLRVAMGPDFERPVELTGRDILQRGEQLAERFDLPKKRSVVLLLLPHSPEMFLLPLGLLLAGHIPAILAWPTNRVDPEKYQRNLVHQLSHLPADLLITVPQLAENLASSLQYGTGGLELERGSSYEKLFLGVNARGRSEGKKLGTISPAPDVDALFLQFSGGTTGAQKAIVVTTAMLTKQLELLGDALKFTDADSLTSWLPMYHDMGLIACYWMPLWHGASSLQMAANDWVINPELLLKYIARYQSTFCWLPNFSFAYLSRRREFMQQEYRLDSVRAWINCSEPVRLGSMMEFAQTFAEWGVRKKSLQTSYAMAETVFAITQSELGKETECVARKSVEQGGPGYTERAFELIDDVYISSGKALGDTELKIVAADGSICAETDAGEIYVRNPCLFSGYWGVEGFQSHTLNYGWHATGDYGFLKGQELFVIGRFKDIVIVGGNNIFPEDVEEVVNTIEGIYPGRVVAFGVEDREFGTQGLAIVAEMKNDSTGVTAIELEGAIRKLVLSTIGTAPRYVAIVPQRWIVKSTAGKISRKETLERFVRERLWID